MLIIDKEDRIQKRTNEMKPTHLSIHLLEFNLNKYKDISSSDTFTEAIVHIIIKIKKTAYKHRQTNVKQKIFKTKSFLFPYFNYTLKLGTPQEYIKRPK